MKYTYTTILDGLQAELATATAETATATATINDKNEKISTLENDLKTLVRTNDNR